MQGALLGKYRVLEPLGQGGMGVVYIGRHETLGHRVVVKVLRTEMSRDAEMLQRFFNEAQSATAIRNPGIVQVYDFGTTPEGQAYIVMELLEGESLTQRLNQRQVDATECCRIGRQIANALQAAHTAGITHRDLKPDNLFLVPDAEVPGGERIKVLDFGIAKLAGELHASGVHTRTNIVMGTPSYMSPEQCRGGGAVDSRADIYSLGCILFRICCGRPPFLGQGPGEIVGAHLHVAPPTLLSLAPEMPAELGALIARMLEKQPDARPQTMTAVSQALDEILRMLGGPAARASMMMAAPPTVPVPAATPTPVPFSLQSGPQPLGPPPSGPPPSGSQAFPSSTTLGAAAGVASVPVRPGRRRLPLVLGGVVVAGAVTAIAIVLATASGDAGSTSKSIAYGDIASASRQEPAATPPPPPAAPAPAPTGPATTPPAPAAGSAEPDIEMDPPATGDAVEAECRKYQAERKWQDLAACADKLQPTDPKRAEQLKTRAQHEAASAPGIAAAETALHDGDLKRARAELDHIWRDTGAYPKLKASYDAAEEAAIAKLAARLEQVNAGDCKAYLRVLAQESASQPARVGAEAQHRVACVVQAGGCDAHALADKGQGQLRAGQRVAALASFEAAWSCKGDPLHAQMAFVAACSLPSLAKAKLFWNRLTPDSKRRAIGDCERNQITAAMLDAP